MRGTPPPEAEATTPTATLLIVPLFHVTGCLATMMLNYFLGAKLVLMPVGRFDPDIAMQIIQDEQITSFGGVPTIMWRILESPNLEKYDLSSVQRASYGGAPAAPELVERIEQVFPEPPQDARDRVRAHRDRVGRDRDRRRGLLRAPGLGRPSGAHGRGAHRRRRGRRRRARASGARCGSRGRT